MKKWGAMLLALMLVVVAGCKGQPASEPEREPEQTEEAVGDQAEGEETPAQREFDGQIKIGLLTTGTAIATYTETVTYGAELAARQLNAAGGVLGKEVVIVPSDGSNTADETINGANRLLEDPEVAAVCGYPLSTGCLAIESLFKQAEKPVVILHGLQFTHFFVWLFGHLRSSMGLPFSTIRIFFLLPFRISSMAVKIPAGPAPTIITSYFMYYLPDCCLNSG